MAGSMKGIEFHRIQSTSVKREIALNAINELLAMKKPVNFSSISKCSGISRSFLYGDKEICERIKGQRAYEIDKKMNQRARYDKTSRSKDVIIEAKDKRIAKLEAENKKLHEENERLRGRIYDMK